MLSEIYKKPYLRYFLRIDAIRRYNNYQDVYVTKKSDVSKLECRYLESNDVKKYAVKYNKKTNPTDLFKFDDFKYDFYKVEFDGKEVIKEES